MPDLIQGPDGWYDPDTPTHCNAGHALVARSHVHGWDGTRLFWWCLHPQHEDDSSRYRYTSGSQQPADWERGTPDHGVTRPERRQGLSPRRDGDGWEWGKKREKALADR